MKPFQTFIIKKIDKVSGIPFNDWLSGAVRIFHMTAKEFWGTPLSTFTQLLSDNNRTPDNPQMSREELVRGEREIKLRWGT